MGDGDEQEVKREEMKTDSTMADRCNGEQKQARCYSILIQMKRRAGDVLVASSYEIPYLFKQV